MTSQSSLRSDILEKIADILEKKILCRHLCLGNAGGAVTNAQSCRNLERLPKRCKHGDLFVNFKMYCVYFYQERVLFILTVS